MSVNPNEFDLTTDAMPLPPRISKENLHVGSTFISEGLKDDPTMPTTDNDNQYAHDNTTKKHKIPHNKSKFKSKSKSTDGVINYNIIHSNGVKIGSTTNYTLNLNKISNNIDDYLSNKKMSVKSMPQNVKTLCNCTEEITIHDILLIKMHMGIGWKDVARKIGFSDGQIYQFQENYPEWKSYGIGEVIYQILLDWKQANTSNAKIGDLASVMWSCYEYDCVERLAESRKFK